MKKYLLMIGILIAILSTYICYSYGWITGLTEFGKKSGYYEAINESGITAFEDGCNSGIREIVKSVCNPLNEYQSFRKITFKELITFLKSDKTDEIKYADNFTCSGYALTLKRNANNQGINCAFVILNYKNDFTGTTDSAHAVNAFDIAAMPEIVQDKFIRIRTLEESKQLKDCLSKSAIGDCINVSGIVYVDPQSDEIIYGMPEGKPYHLLERDGINQSGNLIRKKLGMYLPSGADWEFLKANLGYYTEYYSLGPNYELYRENQRELKVFDRINKVELIW